LSSIVVLMLAACQQIAWKPGAGAADLERDTAGCRAQDAEQAAVQNCLKQRGWVLRQTTSSATDSDAANTEQEVAPASSVEPTVTSTPASTSGSAPTAAATASPPPTRNKAVPAKPKAVDPLAPILIQAWLKAGAQGADLTADRDACVETLGPAHRPDLQKRLYTRALIDCLKARGWSGH
jgi:hypothetical protein